MMGCSSLILLLRLWITDAVRLRIFSRSRCNGWSEASSSRAALLSKYLCLLLEFVIWSAADDWVMVFGVLFVCLFCWGFVWFGCCCCCLFVVLFCFSFFSHDLVFKPDYTSTWKERMHSGKKAVLKGSRSIFKLLVDTAFCLQRQCQFVVPQLKKWKQLWWRNY